jgi:hypothetical protein
LAKARYKGLLDDGSTKARSGSTESSSRTSRSIPIAIRSTRW